MGRVGWGWTGYVMEALGRPDAAASIDGLKVWRRLPEFEENRRPAAAVVPSRLRG